mgnify:CR=1 FL=1|tara:strand:+ start:303 stop:596 length:294 start_codon:yes stop_codon:yes gene_type:complete
MDITLLITVFTTVFVAELGDKTQLATLALSGTTDKPLAVFLGSAGALILTSLLGAIAGGSMAEIIPESLLKAFASIVFLYIGVTITWLSLKSENNMS